LKRSRAASLRRSEARDFLNVIQMIGAVAEMRGASLHRATIPPGDTKTPREISGAWLQKNERGRR
jgi:hypothetical protein